MSNYVKLSSEKYLVDSLNEEIKNNREDQNQKAVKAFTTMTCSLSIVAITLFAALNFSEWVEIVRSWIQ